MIKNDQCSNPVSLCQYIIYLAVHVNTMPRATTLRVFFYISESITFLFPSNAFDDLSFIQGIVYTLIHPIKFDSSS